MRKRIWELDFLRGFFLIGIMAFHFTYDLVNLFGLVELTHPVSRFFYQLGNDWGGVPFLIISGVCVTFGGRPIRRGLTVIGGGMVITLVTVGMYLLQFAGRGIIIYFGVLHCIGLCMLLWPLFKKLPPAALLTIGLILAVAGLYLRHGNVRIDSYALTILGIPGRRFSSSDYFPLLPNLGYFLLGSALGKWLYSSRQTRYPKVNANTFVIRFFSFFGKHSLLFYLLHQPVFAGLILLWTMLV